MANCDTLASSSLYVTLVTSPPSASKMIAVLFSTGVPMWRSRQLNEALSSPSANHWKKGAFELSRVCVKGLCQLRFSRARLAQKPSKSCSASAHSA